MQAEKENATVNQADAITASKRLARALKESPAFERFSRVSERLEENAEANRLFSDYQRAVQDFESKKSWGGASDEEMSRITALQDELRANDIIAEYIAAQEDLIQLLQDTNGAISERLGVDFAQLAKPAKGCC